MRLLNFGDWSKSSLLIYLPSLRLSRLRSSDSVDSGSPPSSPDRKASSGSSSGYLSSKSPTQSPQSSPSATTPWERHYGCWKDHFRICQQQELHNTATGGKGSNSTPSSPVHYRVSRTGRSDSMASIT